MAHLLANATLIDGVATETRPRSHVLVEDDRVTAVWQGDLPADTPHEITDLQGGYLLPGFLDLHVHYADWMPELFLNHGVTSIVDLSQHPWILAQRDGIAAGTVPGPRLLVSSPILGGWLLWDVARTPVDGSEQARQVALAACEAGIDVMKVYTQLSVEELAAITAVARGADLPTIGHLSSVDALEAADAGVTCLAHATGVAMATMSDPVRVAEMRDATQHGISVDYPHYLKAHAHMDPARYDEVIDRLLERGVALEPDLVNTAARWAAPARDRYLLEDHALYDRRDLQHIPQRFRERHLSRAPWRRLSSPQQDDVRKGYERLLQFIGRYHRQGGVVLNGTDTCSFVPPGLATHREMELLVEAGMSPMDAIIGSTSATADYLNRPDLGRISEGALADLVVLDADPTEDIRNTRTIRRVFRGGQERPLRYTPRFQNPIPTFPGFQPNIANPRPMIASVQPMYLKAGGDGATVVVDGHGFTDETYAIVDGVELPAVPDAACCVPHTQYLPHYTRVTVEVPSTLLRTGRRFVRLGNPAPEGGVSDEALFFVQ